MQCLNSARFYYTNILSDLLHGWNRSKQVGILLILCHFYWRICLILPAASTTTTSQSSSSSISYTNNQSFDYIVRFSLLRGIESPANIHWIALSINMFIVLAIAVDVVIAMYQKLFMPRFVQIILSCILKIYAYALFIPLLYHSFKRLDEDKTAIFVLLHDLDFSFVRLDFLDKRNIFQWDIVAVFLETISCAFLAYSSEREGVYILGMMTNIYAIFHIYTNLPYSDKTIRHLHAGLTFYALLLSFSLFLTSLIEDIFSYQSFIIALILIPISYKLSTSFLKFFTHLDLSLIQNIESVSQYSYRLDNLVRQLACDIKLEYEDYSKSQHAHLIEAIILDHKISCEAYPRCFCSFDDERLNPQERIVSKKERNKYLLDYIEEVFVRITTNKQTRLNKIIDLFLYYSFICFLIEKKESKIFAFREIEQILSRQNLSLRELFFLNRFLKGVKLMFLSAEQKIKAPREKFSQMASQRFGGANASSQSSSSNANNNGRMKKNNNLSKNQLNLMVGIEYDEVMNYVQAQFIEGVKHKLNFLQIVASEFIDFSKFKVAAQKFLDIRAILEVDLKYLCRVNSSGLKIRILIENFIAVFAFVQTKNEFYNERIGASAAVDNMMMHQNRNMQQKYLANSMKASVFADDICIVFVSLLGKYGTIKRAQNKLERFFGYRVSEAVGQNVQVLMPTLVSSYHDAIFKDFVYDKKQERQTLNQVEASFPIALGKNRNGWAVPISTRLRSDCFGMECGVCAEIKLIKRDGFFVMTAGESFAVQILSEHFFKNVLSKYFGKSELLRLHLLRMIPMLPVLLKKQTENPLDCWHTTFAILPRIFDKSQTMTNLTLSQAQQQQSNEYMLQTATGGTAGMNGTTGVPLGGAHTQGLRSENKNNKKREQFLFAPNKKYLQKIDNLSQLTVTYDYYEVYFKLYSNTNPYFTYNILEIQKFKKFSDFEEAKNHFAEFKAIQTKIINNLSAPITSLKETSITDEQMYTQTVKTMKSTAYHESLTTAGGLLESSKFGVTSRDIEQNLKIKPEASKYKEQAKQLHNQQLQKQPSILGEFRGEIQSNEQNQPLNYTADSILKQEEDNSPKVQLNDITLGFRQSSGYAIEATNRTELPSLANLLEQNDLTTNNLLTNSQIITNANPLRKSLPRKQGTLVMQSMQQSDHLAQSFQQPPQALNQKSQSLNWSLSNNNSANNSFAIAPSSALPAPSEENHLSFFPEQQQHQQQKQDTTKRSFRNIANPVLMTTKTRKRVVNQNPDGESNDFVKQNYQFFNNQEKLNATHGKNMPNYQNVSFQNEKNPRNEIDEFEDENENKDESSKEKNARRLNRIVSSSIQTGKSKQLEKMRMVKDSILSPKKSRYLKILSVIGAAAIVILVTGLMIESVLTLSQLETVKQCNSFMSWPVGVKNSILSILRQEGLLRLSEASVFPGLSNETFRDSALAVATNDVKIAVELYYEFMAADIIKLTFFSLANVDKLSFKWTNDEYTVADITTPNEDDQYHMLSTIGSMLRYYAVLYSQFLHRQRNDREMIYMMSVVDNIQIISPQLELIQDAIRALTVDQLDLVQSEAKMFLILAIVISIVSIGSIFPIYYKVQKQIEQLFLLFATIQTSHLKSMLNPIIIYLTEENVLKTSMLPEYYIKKRKAITETNRLEKFKVSFVIYSIICLAIMILPPILSSVYTDSFATQTVANIDLLRHIYELKSLFSNNLGISYEYIYKRMVPSATFYDVAFFEQSFPDLASQNQIQLTNMYSFIASAHASSAFTEDKFEKFLFKILEGNICSALQSYPEYVSDTNRISSEECASIRNGVLEDAFQLNVKTFLNVFTDIQDIILETSTDSSSSDTIIQTKILEWEAQLNLADFNSYSTALIKVVDIMKDFMLDVLSQYSTSVLKTRYVLIGLQVLALIVVFFAGWKHFYDPIHASLIESRYLLSILSIDVILENPYIQSFITK